MKKIYYLQKYEIKLGDIIEYNGIKTLVTKELIKLNPELFRVEEEKTLQDYESILIEINSSLTFSPTGAYISVYGWLRDNEPKLYYTKILQLIANDLNDGRYIHERGYPSFHINKEGRIKIHMGGDEGCVYFKSAELAEKARIILGDKVKYLFN